MRPSSAVPARSSGPAYGPRSMLRGLGTFSIVLGVVLVLVSLGLVNADREMQDFMRLEAQHDAEASSLLLEGRVELELEALGALRGLFMDSDSASRGRFDALLAGRNLDVEAAPTARGRPAPERIWVIDTHGRVLHDTVLAPAARGVPIPDAALLATRTALRDGQRTVATGASRAARRVVIARALVVGGRVVGAAGAAITPQALLVMEANEPRRLGLVVIEGRDTIAVLGEPDAPAARLLHTNVATLPGGAQWKVVAVHTRGSALTRWSRGSVAFLALLFLGVGLLRERRQAVRIAERSAELERLSSELLRANRMKSEFLANVSHELRTPLNAIVGFVELLRDGVYGELTPRQAQPVERIAASATHLRGLVDQVLDIAKMAAGRLEVHPETIVLRPFVLNVMSELESLVSEKGLSLSISVGASLPRVRTDPAHLRSILVNLVGNAIKYTPSGGIVVRARLVGAPRVGPSMPTPAGERTLMEEAALAATAPSRDHPWIALQVIDTGIGIAPEDRERIFDEFEQVNAGPRGESMSRGTGLGLAITRRLARLLDGDVRVDSEPGKGSTFTMWMPVSPADLETRKA